MKFKQLGTDFFNYYIGRFISDIGDILAFIGFSMWILGISNSPTQFALIITLTVLIQIVLITILGPVGDRFCRKKLIIIADLFQLVIWSILLFLSIYSFDNIVLISFFYILTSIGRAFYRSGESGILPHIVTTDNLKQALKTRSAIKSITDVLGGVIAGSIVSLLGISFSIAVNIFTFIIVIICTRSIKSDTNPIENNEKVKTKYSLKKWSSDFKDGFKFIIKYKMLLFIAFISFLINFAANPIYQIIPIYTKECFPNAAFLIGLFESLVGFGTTIGSILLLKSTMKDLKMLFLGFLIFSLGSSILFFGNILLSVIAFLILGLSEALCEISISTKIYQTVPKNYRARYSSVMTILGGISTPLGIMVFGFISSLLNSNFAMLFIGLWILIFSPIIFLNKGFRVWMNMSNEECDKCIDND